MKNSRFYLKHLLAVLMVLIVCVSIAVPTYADEVDQSVQVQVIQADSEAELVEAFKELANNRTIPRSALLTVGIARNYSTGKSCEVLLNWTGTARYNGWRFKKLAITNGGSTTYGTIGTGKSYKTYDVDSASTGTVRLGTVQIPTSVAKVYVDFTELQGSLSANSDWKSVINSERAVDII